LALEDDWAEHLRPTVVWIDEEDKSGRQVSWFKVPEVKLI